MMADQCFNHPATPTVLACGPGHAALCFCFGLSALDSGNADFAWSLIGALAVGLFASSAACSSRFWIMFFSIAIKRFRWARVLALHLSWSARLCASLNLRPVRDVA